MPLETQLSQWLLTAVSTTFTQEKATVIVARDGVFDEGRTSFVGRVDDGSPPDAAAIAEPGALLDGLVIQESEPEHLGGPLWRINVRSRGLSGGVSSRVLSWEMDAGVFVRDLDGTASEDPEDDLLTQVQYDWKTARRISVHTNKIVPDGIYGNFQDDGKFYLFDFPNTDDMVEVDYATLSEDWEDTAVDDDDGSTKTMGYQVYRKLRHKVTPLGSNLVTCHWLSDELFMNAGLWWYIPRELTGAG